MPHTTGGRYRMRRLALIAPAMAAFATAAAATHADAAGIATATSSEAIGLRYLGTSADDDVRVTLAGSTFTIDDSGPIQAGAGCTPVAGDATKVACVAFEAGSQFKPFAVVLRQATTPSSTTLPRRAPAECG